MKLYTYFRSSAAYRVRIALALKGLDYEAVPVHLLREGGEQHRPEYRAIHPGGLVPALQTDGGEVLVQSLAIIEYLEETHPEPPLLPPDPLGRARVRGLALTIACDTHPLNNLGVLRYLTERLGASEEQKLDWIRHWIERGLGTFERLLDDPRTGRFCHG
ncbi:MAG: maleylacetoacetate isomerase, partial [Tepidiphilus sp.]|nr:maleylacetoacetate isomerase [Tepidiphilus sp.]